jgi:3'-phosphoadenosine 5'-phosphosulfate (PAPS) 3'-phosphatase
MRRIVLLAALALASAAWAQDQKKEDAKPAAQDKPAAEEKAKPAAVAKKSRRHQDARHCLQKANNTEIIKCAEAYL